MRPLTCADREWKLYWQSPPIVFEQVRLVLMGCLEWELIGDGNASTCSDAAEWLKCGPWQAVITTLFTFLEGRTTLTAHDTVGWMFSWAILCLVGMKSKNILLSYCRCDAALKSRLTNIQHILNYALCYHIQIIQAKLEWICSCPIVCCGTRL